MTAGEYWEEALACTLDGMGLFDVWDKLTPEQRKKIGESLEGSRENYSMAFYSPPSTDRLNEIERDYKKKIVALEAQKEQYHKRVDMALKRILNQPRDALLTVNDDGYIERHNGRTIIIA